MKAANPPTSSFSISRLLGWTLLAWLVFRFISMAWYPLMDTTEARYADIARRMIEKNDWITLWFTDTDPFWGKPPLAFWLSAAGFKILGLTEFAARLPQLLSAMVVVMLVSIQVYSTGERRLLHALSLLAGSLVFMALSAAVTTDMALTLGVTAIMVGFWRALNADSLRQKQIWQLIGNLGWAVGFLSKGPLILVLAGMPIFLWTLLQRQWLRSLKIIFWLPGLTLLLLLTLPWYWAAENRTPGFLDYFIWGEHWHRFVDKGWSGDKYGYAHAEPLGSIWLQALVAWAPWTLLLPVYALIQRINAKHTEAMSAGIGFSRRFSSGTLYWLLFGLWPCIFFSFAGNILWTYVLPAVPAMAICLSAWSCRQKEGLIDILMMAGVLISGAILAVYVLMCRGGDYANEKVSLAVLEDYKQHNHHQKALYFYSGVPFSASFYTRGKALQAPSFDQMQLCSFLVMTDAESNQLTEPQRLGLKPISQHGSRRLYQWLGLPANEPQASKVDISGECD